MGGAANISDAETFVVSGAAPAVLQVGTVLGGRYEILQILGQGGMGAVYKAQDRAVDRLVALKVIRPELAGNSAILQRFKQELILASKISHKNVVRSYDFGESDGVAFITMEFIEGRDLRSLLHERGKLPPDEAVGIMMQVCRALAAAHAEGVVHRDLKPQNVMLDSQGRVVVMDFGLARSLEFGGMTQSGALLGTIEYMSPEQALAEKNVDARSDIFTLGLIFFEVLTGKMPFNAESAIASLLRRTRERAVSLSDLDPTLPRHIVAVVARCLEREPQMRYQNAYDVLNALDPSRDSRRAAAALDTAVWQLQRVSPKWLMAGAAALAAVVLAVGGGWWVAHNRASAPPAAIAPAAPATSLAILPFRNGSGDPSLDWLSSSLSEMLNTDVGESAHLRAVSPDRLQQVLHDLRLEPASQFDAATVRRVADLSNAQTIVWGQFARFGTQIRIDATLLDVKRDRTVSLRADAADEKQLLPAIDGLARSIRENLAVSPEIAKELVASAAKPSSSSLPALRAYNEGIALARQGNNLEAQKRFQAAADADPQFALAYSRLAQTYSDLGYDTDAERISRHAVELSAALPAREKYLIAASHARITNDNQKAIDAYEQLAKVSPNDVDVQFTLGGLYEATGDFDKARQHYQDVVDLDPNYVDAQVAVGRVFIKSGDPQSGLEPLNRALALAVKFDNQEEKATILHAIGVAYRKLDKPDDALRNYHASLDIKRQLGQKRGIAVTLNEIAIVENGLGHYDVALASYQEALKLRREIGDKQGIASTLLDLGVFYDDRGRHDDALKMLKEALQLQRELGNESAEALCLNNIGSIYSGMAQYQDALTYFQQALQLREKANAPADIVEAVHNIADTSAAMGDYDQALTEYLRALDLRRKIGDAHGAAIESYSIGTLLGYEGRYGAALNSKQDALKTFRDLKDRTFWMAEILSGYGDALTLAGRGGESAQPLEEALSLSRELQNKGMTAQSLNFQGDRLYYSGDAKGARALYDQALQAATQAKEKDKVLIARINLARVDAGSAPATAIPSLRSLSQQADTLGLKYFAIEASVDLGRALVGSKQLVPARQELDRALGRAEKLNLKGVQVRSHYWLATALRLQNNDRDATLHYREALRLLDEIRKDTGNDRILDRADFREISSDAQRWAK